MHQVNCDEMPGAAEQESNPAYSLFHCCDRSLPLEVSVLINRVLLNMEVDTSATKSIITKQTYCVLWPNDKALSLT